VYRVASSDGVEIVYDVGGAGLPALVFVHGWAGRRQHWDPQLPYFAPDHLVVRIDLAGHGESGRDRQRWTMASFADDVVAVVDALSLPRMVLIGHSLGGSIVVAAARLLGPRVAGVVGIDTWSGLGTFRDPDADYAIPLPEMRADFRVGSAQFARLMCGPTAAPDLVARITDEVTSMPADIAITVLAGVGEGFALEDELGALDVPLAAISSETFRPKDNAAFAAIGIRHVVIAGTGHYLMLERPEEFNAELANAVSLSG
jgi:pimeloyl-ACP methyl ester carboxylesterase